MINKKSDFYKHQPKNSIETVRRKPEKMKNTTYPFKSKQGEMEYLAAYETMMAYWGNRKEDLYRERFACCRKPLPGLLHLLEQATTMGLPMAVATAAQPANINFILDHLALRRYFKTVVGGTDVQHGKPDPEIFLKSAQILGCEPASCLVFEDALGGIEAARRAGMNAVMICTTIDTQEVAGISHVVCAVPDFTHLDLPKLLG
jgi:HAD superfamily hydrolase (TIGR01509 family)